MRLLMHIFFYISRKLYAIITKEGANQMHTRIVALNGLSDGTKKYANESLSYKGE